MGKVSKIEIDHYLSLPYKVEIETVTEEDGGGFIASIPLLGKRAFLGYGETADEALTELRNVQRTIIAKYLEKGLPIPEPDARPEKSYSGRFVLRIPRDLHRNLAEMADTQSSTLNQYILHLLTRRSVMEQIEYGLSEIKGHMWELDSQVSRIKTDQHKKMYQSKYDWAKVS